MYSQIQLRRPLQHLWSGCGLGAFVGCQYLHPGNAPGASVPALWTQMQEVIDFGSPAKAGGPTGDIPFPLNGHIFDD